MSENMVRVSFTVPTSSAGGSGLPERALRCYSVCFFFQLLLGQAVARSARKLMEAVPGDPGEQDMLRLRGESRALIEERIGNAQGMADDLFSSL